jgi:hypothetical protein
MPKTVRRWVRKQTAVPDELIRQLPQIIRSEAQKSATRGWNLTQLAEQIEREIAA